MIVNTKFYDGFEGEPQITFCLLEDDVTTEKIEIWDGYFNEIMKMIQSEKEGWTGLPFKKRITYFFKKDGRMERI